MVVQVPWVQCTSCCKTKRQTTEFFSPCTTCSSGVRTQCRECKREITRQNMAKRRKDPVQKAIIKEQWRRWFNTPKGRALHAKHNRINIHKRRGKLFKWKKNDWEACKEAWGNCCAYCGGAHVLTQDHFIPLTNPESPGTVPWNMVPACGRCNYSKNKNDPNQWCDNSDVLRRIKIYLLKLKIKSGET